ncbi:MAG: oligogalacturonate lyase family protein [Eubacteriales bacterium]
MSDLFYDRDTGVKIRRISNFDAISHHPFFMVNAYDDKMKYLYFVSHVTGAPQIYCESRETGDIVMLTNLSDINAWSLHPSHDGKYIYFTRPDGGYRTDVQSRLTTKIVDFNGNTLRSDSMITTGMGTTALSSDDRYWAVKYNDGQLSYISVTDTLSLVSETVFETDEISHMQFCPDDSSIIFYAGKLTDRVWIVNRDGSYNRRLYMRNAEQKQWITHESFIPNKSELAMVNWNKGVIAVNFNTGTVRQITDFNAWHAVSNRDGTIMAADTNFPDIGIILFDPRKINGPKYKLCNSDSSNQGKHWNGTFPYDNGPIKVYAPQHTHPHPSFSPDNKFIVFTSDMDGYPRVYEVEIPKNIKELI